MRAITWIASNSPCAATQGRAGFDPGESMAQQRGGRGEMGFWTCTALVVGKMVGSGVFLRPSALAPYGGLSLVGWLVWSTGAVLLALTFSRLARLNARA